MDGGAFNSSSCIFYHASMTASRRAEHPLVGPSLAACVAFLSFAGAALALEPGKTISQYRFDTWGSR